MNFLNVWLQGIVVAVIVATILELLMPSGNNKKYIKVVLGVYIIFNIIAPIVNNLTKEDMELKSIINIEQYSKGIDSYNMFSNNIDINKSNNESIKQIYISRLKSDMIAKLDAKGYLVKDIDIKIDDSENYNIEKIEVYLKQENKQEKRSNVNEIEDVEVKVNKISIDDNEKNVEIQSNISKKEADEIKKYLSNIYDVSEDKIKVY